MIQFVWPWLFLLALLPLLVRYRWSLFDLPVAALTVPRLARFRAAGDSTPSALRKPRGHVLLLWIAWLALLAAAARPQWIGSPFSCPSLVATSCSPWICRAAWAPKTSCLRGRPPIDSPS